MSEECSICLNGNLDCSIDSCKHKFHYNCIKEWSKTSNTCPLCRKVFLSFLRENSEENTIHFQNIVSLRSKLLIFCNILFATIFFTLIYNISFCKKIAYMSLSYIFPKFFVCDCSLVLILGVFFLFLVLFICFFLLDLFLILY